MVGGFLFVREFLMEPKGKINELGYENGRGQEIPVTSKSRAGV